MSRLPSMMTYKSIPYSFPPCSFDFNFYTALGQFASPYRGVINFKMVHYWTTLCIAKIASIVINNSSTK